MLNQSPLISVVIPSFNGEKFIKEAIESVISQTYKFWELILVDDGSSDETSNIMLEYSHNYSNIFFHKHDKNSGLPSALNTGFSSAKGAYYTWISDDNIFKDDSLETMINSISNADVVYANYDSVDENKILISSQKTGKIENIIFRYVVGPCFLYKANCHHRVDGYNKNYKICEDYDFFLRLFYKNFRFKKIDQRLFLFRIHKHQMSSCTKNLVLQTEEIVIQNAENNRHKISERDLSKIYVSRFLKNKYYFKFGFLLKSFRYNFIYTLLKSHKIIFAIFLKFAFRLKRLSSNS
jgi:glycosyltransferase involved in cell wall biosynthesis